MTNHFKPWQVSALFHLTVGLVFLSLVFIKTDPQIIEVPVEVYSPKEIQNLNDLSQKPKIVLKSVNQPKDENKLTREIFGANRNSYTDTSSESNVDAKKGNTLAKETDTIKLEDSDVSSLPTPTEEYLVSEMPVVISEVRPVYPKLAKADKIEGSVALDVLIDDKGDVRQVKIIEGPEIFRGGAIEAMTKFRFKPAKVDGKAVAVRIRYTLNFKLEY